MCLCLLSVVWVCDVCIFRSWQFISVRLFLFVNIYCVWYCISVLFLICFLVFQSQKTNFSFQTWLASLWLFCLKTGAFLPDRCSSSWKKNSQHLQDDHQDSHVGYQESTCWSWYSALLLGSYVALYIDLTFLK